MLVKHLPKLTMVLQISHEFKNLAKRPVSSCGNAFWLQWDQCGPTADSHREDPENQSRCILPLDLIVHISIQHIPCWKSKEKLSCNCNDLMGCKDLASERIHGMSSHGCGSMSSHSLEFIHRQVQNQLSILCENSFFFCTVLCCLEGRTAKKNISLSSFEFVISLVSSWQHFGWFCSRKVIVLFNSRKQPLLVSSLGILLLLFIVEDPTSKKKNLDVGTVVCHWSHALKIVHRQMFCDKSTFIPLWKNIFLHCLLSGWKNDSCSGGPSFRKNPWDFIMWMWEHVFQFTWICSWTIALWQNQHSILCENSFFFCTVSC